MACAKRQEISSLCVQTTLDVTATLDLR